MKNLFLLALILSCAPFARASFAQDSAPELSAPARAASEKLRRAHAFAVGGVGRGGGISATELALRELAREQNAAAIFAVLLDEKSTTKAGQLYALFGLKAADSAQFEARLPAFLADESEVTQIAGCLVLSVKAQEIAQQIEQLPTLQNTAPAPVATR